MLLNNHATMDTITKHTYSTQADKLWHLVMHCDLLQYMPPSSITRFLYAIRMSRATADIHMDTQEGRQLMSITREIMDNSEELDMLESEGYKTYFIGNDILELYKYVWDPNYTLSYKLMIWPCIFRIDPNDNRAQHFIEGGLKYKDNCAKSSLIGFRCAASPYKLLTPAVHGLGCEMDSCDCFGLSVLTILAAYDIGSGYYGEVEHTVHWFKYKSSSDKVQLLYQYYAEEEDVLTELLAHMNGNTGFSVRDVLLGTGEDRASTLNYICHKDRSWKIRQAVFNSNYDENGEFREFVMDSDTSSQSIKCTKMDSAGLRIFRSAYTIVDYTRTVSVGGGSDMSNFFIEFDN